MIDLIREYIRFPTLEDFERFVYTVAYSERVPSHVKFKHSNIFIWRDYQANALRICLSRLIYPSLIRIFLREGEAIKCFRPTAYHVLRRIKEGGQMEKIFSVESRIASIELYRGGEALSRAVEILKGYLYYTTFDRMLKRLDGRSGNGGLRLVDCLESIQGFF